MIAMKYHFPLKALAPTTAAVLLAGCMSDSRPPAPSNVTASVTHAETMAVPGKSLMLAWTFDLLEGWHLYSDARNDSGLPPEVELELPPGWTADPVSWPGAERLVAPGDILDHVYHDKLVLLQRVVVGPDEKFGSEVSITAHLTWLACREACVPGDTTLTVVLQVEPHADPSLDSSAILRSFRALPREPKGGEVILVHESGLVDVRVPGAAHVEFHPAAESAALSDPLHDAAADGDALRLKIRPEAEGKSVRGTLRVTSDEGIVSYLTLLIPAEGDRL